MVIYSSKVDLEKLVKNFLKNWKKLVDKKSNLWYYIRVASD